MCVSEGGLTTGCSGRSAARPAAEAARWADNIHASRKEQPMNRKTDAMLNGVAALLVLFVAMLDPWISVGLAVAFLVVLAIYKASGTDL